MADHIALRDEEHADLLRLCEKEGFDMFKCHSMTFKELRDMWSDYVSDTAMMAGEEPGV